MGRYASYAFTDVPIKEPVTVFSSVMRAKATVVLYLPCQHGALCFNGSSVPDNCCAGCKQYRGQRRWQRSSLSRTAASHVAGQGI